MFGVRGGGDGMEEGAGAAADVEEAESVAAAALLPAGDFLLADADGGEEDEFVQPGAIVTKGPFVEMAAGGGADFGVAGGVGCFGWRFAGQGFSFGSDMLIAKRVARGRRGRRLLWRRSTGAAVWVS